MEKLGFSLAGEIRDRKNRSSDELRGEYFFELNLP